MHRKFLMLVACTMLFSICSFASLEKGNGIKDNPTAVSKKEVKKNPLVQLKKKAVLPIKEVCSSFYVHADFPGCINSFSGEMCASSQEAITNEIKWINEWLWMWCVAEFFAPQP